MNLTALALATTIATSSTAPTADWYSRYENEYINRTRCEQVLVVHATGNERGHKSLERCRVREDRLVDQVVDLTAQPVSSDPMPSELKVVIFSVVGIGLFVAGFFAHKAATNKE